MKLMSIMIMITMVMTCNEHATMVMFISMVAMAMTWNAHATMV